MKKKTRKDLSKKTKEKEPKKYFPYDNTAIGDRTVADFTGIK